MSRCQHSGPNPVNASCVPVDRYHISIDLTLGREVKNPSSL